MFARLIVALYVVAFVWPSPARAQTFHVVHLDPSLNVADINNELMAVGRKGRGFLDSIPFILSPSGLHLFPDVGALSPLQISNSGLILGFVISGFARLFLVGTDGSGYRETTITRRTVDVVQLTDNGRVLLNTYTQAPQPRAFSQARFCGTADNFCRCL